MKQCPRWQWFSQASALSVINKSVHIPRICVTSTSGGGGKTLLSLGLARAWSRRGHTVKPFKKGPDYIDAAWLGAAAGLAATNLDPFFMPPAELKGLFVASAHAAGADICLIEGNRGLYDGLNESGSCSTAQVARPLACPLLLCIDSAKATRTVAAILNGLTTFEAGLDFAGVILNRIGSARHETSLRAAIEANSSLRVLGSLPRMPVNPLPERHMGIASRGAMLAGGVESLLDGLSAFVSKHCDLETILAQARAAPPLAMPDPPLIHTRTCGSPRIGVVRDQALWFYYPENIRALENEGAKIVWLSLFDPANWKDVDAIYLGGGFPEDFAREISCSPCLPLLAAYARAGMPIYAECGGMIILASEFVRNGESWPMAGVFPLQAIWHSRPQGLGYIEAVVIKKNPFYPVGMNLRGHEFHYSSCVLQEPKQDTVLQLRRGAGIGGQRHAVDGLLLNNTWASYTHIFAPSVPCWARNFTTLAAKA